jgi:hypothetical protein
VVFDFGCAALGTESLAFDFVEETGYDLFPRAVDSSAHWYYRSRGRETDVVIRGSAGKVTSRVRTLLNVCCRVGPLKGVVAN